ncbi:oxidoreductase [Perkinsela sp. CCAP 1560/4]|nr:oxidoreductase [Perkinsela sp. CCAP 1560/4]|eukprot:KNH07264.1 oxidoreductase [Perkinsela sp. CCAP 1560/4]
MIQTQLLFIIGLTEFVRQRDFRYSTHRRLSDSKEALWKLCGSHGNTPLSLDLSWTQRAFVSIRPDASHEKMRSWRRLIFGLGMIFFSLAVVQSLLRSTEGKSETPETSVRLTAMEKSHEAGNFTRLRLRIDRDDDVMESFRRICTKGYVTLSNADGSVSAKGVVVQWEVDTKSVECTLLYQSEGSVDFPIGAAVDVSPRRGSRLGHFQSFDAEGKIVSVPRAKGNFIERPNTLSFLGLPRHVDRLVMISTAEEIPELYPIFCRLTGFASSGPVEYTNFTAKEADVLRRKQLLWIIEADSPEEIPLMRELLHVSRGSHYFDFYPTTKKSWWKWPSGIGTLNADTLRSILPREIIDSIPNGYAFWPFTSSKYTTGFVISGSDGFARKFLGDTTGELMQLLPQDFDATSAIVLLDK